ncbi:MAG: thioredoxin [Rikenellaceae bacterium]|nr:thioredoxin [Rikenellaceae bacterium]
MATINLTKGGFVRRVADIDAMATDWKFLGDKPAMIDFYASWCGPCQRLLPIVESLADEFEGKVDIYKVNVDQEEELAAAFNVRTIPTLIFIPLSGKPEREVGAKSESELRERLNNLLK